jgi:predicted transcriptional regulator
MSTFQNEHQKIVEHLQLFNGSLRADQLYADLNLNRKTYKAYIESLLRTGQVRVEKRQGQRFIELVR